MKNLNLELYKNLSLIRKSEEEIIAHYHEDEMKTPMHMSMGEEAIATGVCLALDKNDQVFGTYRSHAIFLAKTQDTDSFFSEMYGKETSLLRGKGGSMHLCAPETGFMGTSAIVASAISVAVGAAFANKVNNNNKITAVFFGDGAVDEGTFWESLNVACLMKIPVLFVCEDNGFAVHTPKHIRQGYNSIADVVSKFNCNVLKNNSTDVEVIYNLTLEAIKLIHKTKMPCFLDLKYYRYLEHVGVNEDFEAGYRQKDEFRKWLQVDPVKIQREKLIKSGMSFDVIEQVESEISNKISLSLEKAKQANFADKNEIYKEVYYAQD